MRTPQLGWGRCVTYFTMAAALVLAGSGETIATRVRWARSPTARVRGLLGGAALLAGEALVLEPAKQLHSFRMRYPLDVIFCDRDWDVRHVVRPLRPNRVTRWVAPARFGIEMRAGELAANVTVGVRLTLSGSPFDP